MRTGSTVRGAICAGAWALTCLALVCPAQAGDEPAPLTVTLKSEKDRAAVSVEGEAVLIRITSPSGIGRAEITPAKEWPKTLVLRLELKALEGFRARAGATEIAGSLNSRVVELLRYTAAGKAEKAPNADGRWRLEISRQKNWIRVELPTEPFRSEKSLQVQWIDFFR